MAMDAICLQAVLHELRPQLLGARIDKVQQPSRDQVILLLRGNRRLLLSAGANTSRIQTTELSRDNPMEPPMFCMLLRKHLVGGHLAALNQPVLDRLVELEIDMTDDFGRPGTRTLVLEAMGRHSNLILLDEERRIIDCLRRVDTEMSMQRQVLPGLFYQRPSVGERTVLTDVTRERFDADLAAANAENRVDSFLLEHYFGISPLIAREISFRATGETDSRIQELEPQKHEQLWNHFSELSKVVNENNFTPVCLKQDGKFKEFSFLPIAQYGNLMEQARCESFSALMDDFYEAREQQERVRQRGQDLVRTATTARDRLTRKLAMQEKDYEATRERDQLRIFGDLITSNLYQMSRGETKLVTENYYDENREISVPLDPLLTPQQNAAKYYKRYTKARTAEKCLREQIEIARRDVAYLESVLEEIREAETEQDFNEIRAELKDAGYLKVRGKEKKEMRRSAKPREFRTSGGFRVLVGRNNRQNDHLTLKDADFRDIWFHTQKIHGSHVILRTDGQEPAQNDIAEAATLAAYYSQARESGNVPVDYTQVRNVKKPAGARPGMVIYTTYRTLFVTPEEQEIKKLQGR